MPAVSSGAPGSSGGSAQGFFGSAAASGVGQAGGVGGSGLGGNNDPVQQFNDAFNTTNSGTAAENESETTSAIDTEGMQYILNTLLGNTGGLATVAQGEDTAGVYDSATTTNLIDQLLTQSAGYAASKNTVTDTSGTSSSNTATTGSVSSSLGGGGSGGGGGILGAVGSLFSSVLCTELYRQGILPRDLYLGAAEYNARNSISFQRGYHFWAVPYVRWMRHSRIATILIAPVIIGRANWLIHGHYSIGGFIAQKILYPLSYLIGRYLVRKSQRSAVISLYRTA